jgi:cytochrome c6
MTLMKKTTMLALALTLALPLAADNAAVYKAKCSACHGPDGSGQTTMGKKMNLRDLRSPDVQKQTNAELTKIITDGKNKMPAYKTKLTEAEIKGLVAHMRELVPQK